MLPLIRSQRVRHDLVTEQQPQQDIPRRESACRSVVSDSGTPWTAARQVPLSMEFSRQEHCNGEPFPSPGDLPDPWIKPRSHPLQADSLLSEPPGKPKIYLDSILKSKDITLPTKVCIRKGMFFPVIMYGCESGP